MTLTKIDQQYLLWAFGNIIATVVGINLAIEYTLTIGFLAFYALAVLVDIRFELTEKNNNDANKRSDK